MARGISCRLSVVGYREFQKVVVGEGNKGFSKVGICVVFGFFIYS
jgi:hypothetical protein